MLGSTFGAGPGASVSATNPRSVAQTVHRHGNKIKSPTQVRVQGIKSVEEPTCRSRGPRSSQKSKIPPGEKLPLPGRRARRGWGLPRKRTSKMSRQGLPGLAEAKPPHPTTPPRPTSSIDAVSSRKVTKWQPFATWQPLSTRNTYRRHPSCDMSSGQARS